MPNINDRPLKIGTKVPTAIYTASDEPVCIVDSMKELKDDAAVARRLVACWNACMGFSTEGVEGLLANFFTPPYDLVRQLEAQNAELLKALKMAVRQGEHDMLLTGDELRYCRATITKVEAGTT